ncbi:DUF6879 family protein [Streptomyces sp. R301]|uniref:DUF6879 family protein n=1 Tax=unclassified Streptomyces TaxID=2593676 RepID=UPI003211ECEC
MLDVTDRSNPLENTGHFWLFDSATAVPLCYTDDGGFAGAEVLADDHGPTYTGHRDTALAHAVPFADWWAEHAE